MSLKRRIIDNKTAGTMQEVATAFAGFFTKEGDAVGNSQRKHWRIHYKHKKKYPNQYRRMFKSYKGKSLVFMKGQDRIIKGNK